MTSRDFAYWLQGYFEITALELDEGQPLTLNAKQTECIKKHLAMVFVHEIDPSFPAEQQAALDAAHAGTSPPGPTPFKPSPGPVMPGQGGGLVMRC